MMMNIGITFIELVISYYDNTSTFNMSKNHVLHSTTKHREIKYNVMKEKVAEKEIRLECINTKE